MKTYKEFRKSIGFPVKERKVEEVIRSEKPLKEDVVDQLRSVVKKKKEQEIKFKSGTSVPIDPESAKTILKTFDTLNSSKKKKMQDNMNKDTKSFLKILDFAFSNAKQVKMSSIKEFYIEKEKRELINTIGSAKYVSEDQKEAMIAVMLNEQDVDHWKDQVIDMEKRLKDKIRNDEWDRRDDEAVALQARIDSKKKDIRDKESRTTYS